MAGNFLAITCAMIWSLSIILMKISGARIHPLVLNLGKNVIGLLLLIITAVIVEGRVHFPAPQETAWLMLSGLLGIGIADGMILKAMQYLPASQVAILECLFAPFVITLSVLILDERPSPIVLVGGALILTSLLFLSPKDSGHEVIKPADQRKGALLMSGGLFLVAFGIIIVKPLFQSVPMFSLVTIRMFAGVVGSGLVFLRIRDRRARFTEFLTTPRKGILLWGCFLSAYVSMILWIAGYKYLQASVAAMLNQTSTIFTVLFAMFFLQEKLTRSKVIAILLAMSGVAVITLART